MDSFYIYVYFMSYQEAQKLFDLYTIEEKRNFLELFLSLFFQKENSKIAWITSFYLKEELLNIWASTFPF